MLRVRDPEVGVVTDMIFPTTPNRIKGNVAQGRYAMSDKSCICKFRAQS